MQLECLVDHTYQGFQFEAGKTYSFGEEEDTYGSDVALRLLANYGPPAGQRNPKDPAQVRFVMPGTAAPKPEDTLSKAELVQVAVTEGVFIREDMTVWELMEAIVADRAARAVVEEAPPAPHRRK